MACRLYLHDLHSDVVGTLPSTEQSTKTAAFNYEAQTNNRSMNTTIGTAQVERIWTNTTDRTNATAFVTKFISEPIDQTGIAANTWKYNFAVQHSLSTLDDYPVTDSNNYVPICCYVWRPSTGTKVGNILDGNSATNYYDTGDYNHAGTTNEVSEDGTFTGAAVAGATTGDVIVFEAWIYVYCINISQTFSYFYDGTVETLADNTIVSDHASFIETPEDIVFLAPSAAGGRLYKSFSSRGFIPAMASVTF